MPRRSHEVLRYGRGKTLIGDAMAFATDKGARAIRLLGSESMGQVLAEMSERNPNMDLVEDQVAAKSVFKQVDAWLAGRLRPQELALDLRGTTFQLRVWREMLKVPHGQTLTYTELARRAGNPRAVRAAASACARNPVGLLVPCHRIVRQDGSLGGYYWGLEKKKRLLAYEQATRQSPKR